MRSTTIIRYAVVLSLLLVVMGCDGQSEADLTHVTHTEDLALLTREGCVNTATMRTNLDAALRSLRLPAEYQVIDLDTLTETDARGGYPTPTVLYKNRDLFGLPEPPTPHGPET